MGLNSSRAVLAATFFVCIRGDFSAQQPAARPADSGPGTVLINNAGLLGDMIGPENCGAARGDRPRSSIC
jgi:hypothetical protein